MNRFFQLTFVISIHFPFVLLALGLNPVDALSYQARKGQDLSRMKATQRPYIINNRVYYPIPSARGYQETGVASWYGSDFHGKKTSNGETYNMHGPTAAHKILPMNTMVLVQNLENGRKTVVRINDRGPFVKDRIIDLSYLTAKELGIFQNGTAKVRIVALAEKRGEERDRFTDEEEFDIQDFNRGEFYIQVGAFTIKSNARRLAEKFAQSGRDVIIQSFTTPENTFYRVMVFSGNHLNQARALEDYLSRNGFPGAFVIAK